MINYDLYSDRCVARTGRRGAEGVAWLAISTENGRYLEAWVQVSALHLMLRRYKPDKDHQQPMFKYPKLRQKAG